MSANPGEPMVTPSMEDYLERIYMLVHEKGYARVASIAEMLDVQAPSVTRMVQKLAEEGYVNYEKYRGITLTEKGSDIGGRLQNRHTVLSEFLRMIGVTSEDVIWRDVEGIEHHVSPGTMRRIERLVKFFQDNPEVVERLQAAAVPADPGAKP